MMPSSITLLNVCSLDFPLKATTTNIETCVFISTIFTTPCECWGRKGHQLVPWWALALAHARHRSSSGEIVDLPRCHRGRDHDQKSHVSLPNTRGRTLSSGESVSLVFPPPISSLLTMPSRG